MSELDKKGVNTREIKEIEDWIHFLESRKIQQNIFRKAQFEKGNFRNIERVEVERRTLDKEIMALEKQRALLEISNITITTNLFGFKKTNPPDTLSDRTQMWMAQQKRVRSE